jgi:hypothetical protein
VEDADEFEKDYNFRFEVEEGRLESFSDSSRHFFWEFGAASFLQFTWSFIILHGPARQIQGHARFPENSVRERNDKRKRQRKEKAERKEAEKIRRTEELKRCSAALLVQSPLFKKSILMNHHVCT